MMSVASSGTIDGISAEQVGGTVGGTVDGQVGGTPGVSGTLQGRCLVLLRL